jgi:uncharacterized membrane protein
MTSVHPFSVHFPVALLTVAAVLELVAWISGRDEYSRAGWWNQLAGSFGLAAAVLSGLSAEKAARIGADAAEMFGTHQQVAFAASVVFALLLFWRIGARTRIPPNHRLLYLVLFVAGVILLLTGAWYGGELVFRFGVRPAV